MDRLVNLKNLIQYPMADEHVNHRISFDAFLDKVVNRFAAFTEDLDRILKTARLFAVWSKSVQT